MTSTHRDERSTPGRLVLRLFLRRLVDNDLVSPNADRHESLALVGAMVVSLAVFVTFFITSAYLAAFIQLPGPTAVSALSDRFLFLAASIAISALVALMVWDALALEPRDAAILGPLPLPSRLVTRTKLAAALVFGTAFAVALNAVPSVLYPMFLTMNLHGMTGRGTLQLIAAHATSVVMAGWFGFFSILAARGVVRLVIGERGFRRVSSPVQSVLVVGAVTALFLAPTVRKTTVRDWVSGAAPAPLPARPVLWYLGMNETAAGHIVAETPVVLPPRIVLLPFLRNEDEQGRAVYRPLVPKFIPLARRAWLAAPLVAILAVVTFLLNNRRLPELATAGRAPSRLRASVRRLAEWSAADPETRAGFSFTWQTLTRSPPHRTILAVAVAAGLTHLLMVLAASGVHRWPFSSAPVGVRAIDNVVVVSLLAGFRYAVTVPPEFAANWTLRMAWLGDARRYLAGATGAALVVLAIGPLVLLLPLNLALFGFTAALLHSICGVVFAVATLDALFLTYRHVPFACSYLPLENPKLLWPGGLVAGLLVTYGFAGLEAQASQTPAGIAALVAALGAIVLVIKRVDGANRSDAQPVNFDERPRLATQRLGLFERATND
jgi:hypothetical protein